MGGGGVLRSGPSGLEGVAGWDTTGHGGRGGGGVAIRAEWAGGGGRVGHHWARRAGGGGGGCDPGRVGWRGWQGGTPLGTEGGGGGGLRSGPSGLEGVAGWDTTGHGGWGGGSSSAVQCFLQPNCTGQTRPFTVILPSSEALHQHDSDSSF